MKIKEVQPTTFLYSAAETKVSELHKFLPVGQSLFAEAVQMGYAIAGPVHWHYHGFFGDARKPFILEVALPVQGHLHTYDGQYQVKRTDAFRSVSHVHEGAWGDLPLAYSEVMKFMHKQGLQPSGVNREIYIQVDFDSPQGNTTEIQVGIQ